MNPQVFTMTMPLSSCLASCSTSKSFARSCAIITSLSKMFLAHPKVTTFTFLGLYDRALMRLGFQEQAVDKLHGVKVLQVPHPLAHAHEPHRNAELV